MEYLSDDKLLSGLPLILAGPILRHTCKNEVTVWLALKRPCQVELRILATEKDGVQLGRCCLHGHRETVAIGRSLHLVAVTARAQENVLSPGQIYAYDLHFTQPETLEENSHGTISLDAALQGDRRSVNPISYFAHKKPTFALPPAQLSQLKIIHGSCRKPHGKGFDALPILDSLLESDAGSSQQRPHQLFITGDQIYGDDVSDPLLWLASPLGNALLGWQEKLPIDHAPTKDVSIDDVSTDSVQSQHAKQLPAGKRAPVATQKAGLTAGLTGKEERTTSHLFSFGEYCAIYLLSHSPTCWPHKLPDGQEITQGWKTIRRWNRNKQNMKQFLHTLWKVQRLMANIPTYTIFDDHDVSDD